MLKNYNLAPSRFHNLTINALAVFKLHEHLYFATNFDNVNYYLGSLEVDHMTARNTTDAK